MGYEGWRTPVIYMCATPNFIHQQMWKRRHFPGIDSHLTLQQPRQVVEAQGDVRVVRAQHLLANRQRALVQPLGLSVVALRSQTGSQKEGWDVRGGVRQWLTQLRTFHTSKWRTSGTFHGSPLTLFFNNTAKLLRLVATCGWSEPSAFS